MRKRDPSKVQEQRERIMQAALACFARKGVSGTSTDDICRAAAVSSGTLYYYFTSRDGLLHALIDYAHMLRDERLTDLHDVPDLLDALIDLQFGAMAAINAHGISTDVFLELLAYAARNDAARAAFREASARVLAIITDAVRAHQQAGKLPSHIAPEALAVFFPMAVSGMSIAEIVDGTFDRQRYRDTYAALLRNALAEAPPRPGAATGRAPRQAGAVVP